MAPGPARQGLALRHMRDTIAQSQIGKRSERRLLLERPPLVKHDALVDPTILAKRLEESNAQGKGTTGSVKVGQRGQHSGGGGAIRHGMLQKEFFVR